MAQVTGKVAGLLFAASIFACSVHVEEKAREQGHLALESAAIDLMQIHFHTQAMRLFQEACRTAPDGGQVLRIAGIMAERGDTRAAGACLERFHPESRSEELEAFMLALHLKDGNWQAARSRFDEDDEDPKLKKLNDILSQSKSSREPFNLPNALNWHVEGCHAKYMDGSLILSSSHDRWLRTGGLGFHTTLGWNGRDFRQQVDMRFTRLTAETRILWGLSSVADDATTEPVILLDYHDGGVSLRVQGEETSAGGKWYMPMNRWLTLGLEYITRVDSEEWTGKVRVFVAERSSRRRLLVLEMKRGEDFPEGRFLSGFFTPADWERGRSACRIHVDNFSFDN